MRQTRKENRTWQTTNPKPTKKGVVYMIEALASILAYLANVWIDFSTFFANIITESNYISLVLIVTGIIMLGISIGLFKSAFRKSKHSPKR